MQWTDDLRPLDVYHHGHYCRQRPHRLRQLVRLTAQLFGTLLLAGLVALGVFVPLLLVVILDAHLRGVVP